MPASVSTPRCFDTFCCPAPSRSASSVTLSSRSRRRSRARTRSGSPSARKRRAISSARSSGIGCGISMAPMLHYATPKLYSGLLAQEVRGEEPAVSVVEAPVVPAAAEHPVVVGPVGRLGRFAADHVRAVSLAWAAVALALAVFAPQVETALSGAGWQANGSESVKARALVERSFRGISSSAPLVVVHSPTLTADAPGFRSTLTQVESVLGSDPRVTAVFGPRSGASISRDGHTALVVGGAGGDPTAMVAAADSLKGKLQGLETGDVTVSVTGASGMWSDFNEANRTAMMKSELYSWPITLAIMLHHQTLRT